MKAYWARWLFLLCMNGVTSNKQHQHLPWKTMKMMENDVDCILELLQHLTKKMRMLTMHLVAHLSALACQIEERIPESPVYIYQLSMVPSSNSDWSNSQLKWKAGGPIAASIVIHHGSFTCTAIMNDIWRRKSDAVSHLELNYTIMEFSLPVINCRPIDKSIIISYLQCAGELNIDTF
jgi:hypothetical protein